MAILTEIDNECAEMASAVFDLSDSNSWLRAEACDGMWVVTLRDEDATRAEVAFEADELAHVLQTLGSLVEPAEPPIVAILRALPNSAEYICRLAGGDVETDLDPLLDGIVTDNLREKALQNLGVSL
jgi:hypothetical protein